MGSRTWIKIYCEPWIKGSLRQETRELRGTWADILALAGNSSYGELGIIQLAPELGLNDEQIAGLLNISLSDWLADKQRLLDTERIEVDGKNCIKVVNFLHYQSEYNRLKKYRGTKKSTKKSTPKGNWEKEKEKEKENRKRKDNGNFPEWITILQNFQSFRVENEWIHEIESMFADIDLKDAASEFVDYWSEQRKKIKSMKAAFRNRLRQCRQWRRCLKEEGEEWKMR